MVGRIHQLPSYLASKHDSFLEYSSFALQLANTNLPLNSSRPFRSAQHLCTILKFPSNFDTRLQIPWEQGLCFFTLVFDSITIHFIIHYTFPPFRVFIPFLETLYNVFLPSQENFHESLDYSQHTASLGAHSRHSVNIHLINCICKA